MVEDKAAAVMKRDGRMDSASSSWVPDLVTRYSPSQKIALLPPISLYPSFSPHIPNLLNPAALLAGFPPASLISFPFLFRSLQRRMAVTTDSTWDDDEWEICNDNGFVYKHRRCWRTAAKVQLPPSEDPEAEMRRHQMARRRRCLLGLRDKYRRELDQWQALSTTLLDLTSPIPTAATAPSPPLPPPPYSAFSQSIDDLLS